MKTPTSGQRGSLKKSPSGVSKSSKRIVTFEAEAGGAIRHAKRKEPVTSEKILQAVDFNTRGGAIRKARKKEPKRNKKLEQALASHKGGRIRFHDKQHKYLYENLSGKGGRLDSAMCRKMVHRIMDKYDPTMFQSYLNGRVMDTPRFHHDHPIITPRPKRDARADVINHGGSLNGITHSVDGILRTHNSEFHSFLEIV